MEETSMKYKNPPYGRHWLFPHVSIISVFKKTEQKKVFLIWYISPFLWLYMETIRNRTRGQSMHPIRNTSPFLRLHAWMIWTGTQGQSTHGEGTAKSIHTWNPKIRNYMQHTRFYKHYCKWLSLDLPFLF